MGTGISGQAPDPAPPLMSHSADGLRNSAVRDAGACSPSMRPGQQAAVQIPRTDPKQAATAWQSGLIAFRIVPLPAHVAAGCRLTLPAGTGKSADVRASVLPSVRLVDRTARRTVVHRGLSANFTLLVARLLPVERYCSSITGRIPLIGRSVCPRGQWVVRRFDGSG